MRITRESLYGNERSRNRIKRVIRPKRCSAPFSIKTGPPIWGGTDNFFPIYLKRSLWKTLVGRNPLSYWSRSQRDEADVQISPPQRPPFYITFNLVVYLRSSNRWVVGDRTHNAPFGRFVTQKFRPRPYAFSSTPIIGSRFFIYLNRARTSSGARAILINNSYQEEEGERL